MNIVCVPFVSTFVLYFLFGLKQFDLSGVKQTSSLGDSFFVNNFLMLGIIIKSWFQQLWLMYVINKYLASCLVVMMLLVDILIAF